MWKHMDSETLEKEYSPSAWSCRFGPEDIIQHHVQTTKQASEQVVSKIACTQNVPYGPSDTERMDVFAPNSLPKDCPIFVFIHGGYWQEMSKDYYSFLAECLVESGAAVVLLGYILAPHGTMDDIVGQVKSGMKHVLNMAAERGSRGVYVSGHSAGGHLTAMVLAEDWNARLPQAAHLLKGGVLISGVYDLEPLVSTYINKPLNMSISDAQRNSPMTHLNDITAHCRHQSLLVVVGQHESNEFKRQSQQFYQALHAAGVSCEYLEVVDVDHFDIIENLQDTEFTLTKKICQIMGL